ncbi:hypothetical protein B0H17DRAFT_1143321 [Mycena rosella]|uniref:Uncharacterized protein n=1 Tax=Mycena rosella TaxID=1033263 RepID=A0AAD7G7X7_MYCRO|nr:hypothetical protein B0H17DRAFT_1143321 [Mycena rosella]
MSRNIAFAKSPKSKQTSGWRNFSVLSACAAGFPLFTLVFEVGLQDSVGNGVIGNVLFSDPAMPLTIGIGMAEKWGNKRKEIVGIMGVIESVGWYPPIWCSEFPEEADVALLPLEDWDEKRKCMKISSNSIIFFLARFTWLDM